MRQTVIAPGAKCATAEGLEALLPAVAVGSHSRYERTPHRPILPSRDTPHPTAASAVQPAVRLRLRTTGAAHKWRQKRPRVRRPRSAPGYQALMLALVLIEGGHAVQEVPDGRVTVLPERRVVLPRPETVHHDYAQGFHAPHGGLAARARRGSGQPLQSTWHCRGFPLVGPRRRVQRWPRRRLAR